MKSNKTFTVFSYIGIECYLILLGYGIGRLGDIQKVDLRTIKPADKYNI